LTARVVYVALKLHHKAFRDAVEIHDEAVQDMLAPELQAQHRAVAEERPRVSLARRRVQTQLTRERKPLGVCESAEWVHPRAYDARGSER